MTNNYILLYIGISLAIVSSVLALKSGPFISTLMRAEKCKHTQCPYEVVPSGELTVELYNTSKKTNLMRGNLTLYKPIRGLTLSVHDYFLVDGQWQPIYSINRLSCHFYPVAMMGKLFGIKYNRKTCTGAKGSYVFNNIDFDLVDHVYTSSREYGTILRIVEILNKNITAFCQEYEFVVTPKKE